MQAAAVTKVLNTDFYSSPVSISSQHIIQDLKANSLYICSSCRDHVPQSKGNNAGIITASTDIRRGGQKRRRKIKKCNKKNLNDAPLCPCSNYVVEIEIDISNTKLSTQLKKRPTKKTTSALQLYADTTRSIGRIITLSLLRQSIKDYKLLTWKNKRTAHHASHSQL